MNLPRPSHGDNILQRVKFNTICGRTIFAAVIMVISVLRSMHLFKLGYIISGYGNKICPFVHFRWQFPLLWPASPAHVFLTGYLLESW